MSANERAIVANYYICGRDNEVLAILRGVRCQVVPVRRLAQLDATTYVEFPRLVGGARLGETGIDVGPDQIVTDASARGLLSADRPDAEDADLLLEGFATAAAYEIASALAEQEVLDVDAPGRGRPSAARTSALDGQSPR